MTACLQDSLHDRFLKLLPRIEVHGKIYFRHKKGEEKAEALQEMRALAWKWFQREVRNGKDPANFMFNFTRFLVLAVNAGRGVVGMQKTKDVMSPRCQRERGFRVEPLPSSPRAAHESLYSSVHGQDDQDAFEERLRDNMQSPVPDQVAFRIDFPEWMRTWSDRDRRIIHNMSMGEPTFDLAQKFGCSPARISQKRNEYREDWERFCADDDLVNN
jgi:hypothetical protein